MTKYISKISALFTVIILATLTSCSSDDDNNVIAPSNIDINLTEVGHGGTLPHVHAGEDLHLEAEILADAKINTVKIEIHSESNSSAPAITASYEDYKGLKNATFHKHIDIPANQPAGIYHLHLTVTDLNGKTKTAEAEIEVLAAEPEGEITIDLTEIGHGEIGHSHAHAGDDIHVEGTITSVHPIATIAIEIHNESDASAPEIEASFSNYAGQTSANFHEHIQIPTNQPAGHYHFHITVTDNDGHSYTKEYELEIE